MEGVMHSDCSAHTAHTAVLIHKKGEAYDLGKWRLAALTNTIYKLWGSALLLRVGCACRPNAITYALRLFTDGNGTYYTQTTDLRHPTPVTSLYALCLDQDLLVLCWSSLKLQHTS